MSPVLLHVAAQDMGVLSRHRYVICKRGKGDGLFQISYQKDN